MSDWPPINDYAAIGDGRTIALVSRTGEIDWLCLPDVDSPSVFAAVLDPEQGGRFTLAPAVPFSTTRRYVTDSNILETTYVTDHGHAVVLDALTLPDGGLAPERELVRKVEVRTGRVPFAWTCAPRFDYGRRPPRLERRGAIPVASNGAEAIGLLTWDAGRVEVGDGAFGGHFEVQAGSSALFALVYAADAPLVLPAREDVNARLTATSEFWQRWARGRSYDGPWRDAVIRSALALKLLVFAPSGAIAAAATTSLPEKLGGSKNYDYRFSWLRDAAFTLDALLALGCGDEADAFFWWLLHASQLTHPYLQVLYRLDGGTEATESELPLAGYRHSRPVRIGNGAADQLQLDAYGDVLLSVWLYQSRGGAIDRDTGKRLAAVADLVCSIWRQPDAGIWEIRDESHHFTEGKMKCAAGLERMADLVENGSLPTDSGRASRWRSEAQRIRDFVERHCWSDVRGSYVRHADGDELDAAVLLAAQSGYANAAVDRLERTIDTLQRHLGAGRFLYRHSRSPGEEGAFIACSFWLVEALARVGRVDEAGAAMDALVDAANDVGLYSEQVDPETGEFLGNFPQGLSHLAVITAALAVEEAKRK